MSVDVVHSKKGCVSARLALVLSEYPAGLCLHSCESITHMTASREVVCTFQRKPVRRQNWQLPSLQNLLSYACMTVDLIITGQHDYACMAVDLIITGQHD